MIRAVLFDLGDTLVNFQQADVEQAFRDGAKASYGFLIELGLTPPPFERYYRYQRRLIRLRYLISQILGREFKSRDLLAHASRKLRLHVPQQHLDELAWRWYKPLADQSSPEPGAHEVLERLQQKDLKLAIVSNTFVAGDTLDRHLQREDLLKFFPVRVYSCEVGIRKPRQRIFQIAMEQLHVHGDQCVFVGDNYRIDVKGARRAGMFAVLKDNHSRRRKLDEHSRRITRLTDLPAAIEQLDRQAR